MISRATSFSLPLCVCVGLSLAAAGAVSGCGGPRVESIGSEGAPTATPTPTATPSGGASLSSGSYAYTIDAVTANSCWSASKNLPPVPSSVDSSLDVAGASVTVTTQSQVGTPQTYAMTLSGASLTGTSSADADLNSQGVDCVLHVEATFDGTVTGTDAFEATQHVSFAAASGSGCNLLVGNLDPRQFDALPCSLDFHATGAKH